MVNNSIDYILFMLVYLETPDLPYPREYSLWFALAAPGSAACLWVDFWAA